MAKKNETVKPNEGEVIQEQPKAKAFKFPEALVKTLQEHSHINCAWVNEDGVWHFAEKPGFTAFSREEILNG